MVVTTFRPMSIGQRFTSLQIMPDSTGDEDDEDNGVRDKEGAALAVATAGVAERRYRNFCWPWSEVIEVTIITIQNKNKKINLAD